MQNNESNIRFGDLINLFVSKLWIMILVAVIVGGSIFTYKYLTYEPLYKSSATMYILRQGENEENVDYSEDFNVALSVVSDCEKLLTSHKVLDEVIEQNKLPYSYEELSSMVSIKTESKSRYIEITVVTNDPEKSKLIADSICNFGEKAIDALMGYDQINKYDDGTLENTPCNSKFSYTIILGALVAFILTYIVVVLFYIFDDKVSDPDLVEKNLGLSVLVLVPNMKKENARKDYYVYQGKTATKRHRYYTKNTKENR